MTIVSINIPEIIRFCFTLQSMTDTYIFISYSTRDSDFVHTLCRSLEECGVSVWVDTRNMRGGSGEDDHCTGRSTLAHSVGAV